MRQKTKQMGSDLPLYKALGLRVGRFLRKILLLVLALVLVVLVLRYAAYGSQSSEMKVLRLFRLHSKLSTPHPSEGELQEVKDKTLSHGSLSRVFEKSPRDGGGSSKEVASKPDDKMDREKEEEMGNDSAKEEKVEKEEQTGRMKDEKAVKTERDKEEPGTEVGKIKKQIEAERREKEEREKQERARKEKEGKEEMERKLKEVETKRGGKAEKDRRKEGQRQKGAKGGKGKGKKKTDTGVVMFYNASLDSFQPLWQEPEFLHGKRRNLTIVMYNLPTFVSMRLWNDVTYQARCNVSCYFTSDLSLMPQADAVVFFAVNMPRLQTLPPRPPGQIWVLWAHEGPNYVRGDSFKDSIWHHQINWTMNYRLDADFWYPYYYFLKRENPFRTNLTALEAGKTRMAAWIVSNCGAPSQRQLYVQELQKHMQVDVYGKCSGVFMDRKNTTRILTSDYKFYLALENSLCKDYITEKAFKNMQLADVVVVVRGGADYSKFLPKNSYIDASKFHSPKELAQYLKHLDKNPEEYLQYFQWKRLFRTTSHPPVCRLCLHLQEPERYRKTYADVWRWYREDQCNDKRQDF